MKVKQAGSAPANSGCVEFKTFELRLDELTEEGEFEGYASTFGNSDSWGDVIEKGAFKKTIRERRGRVPILWQHSPSEPIGRSMEMEEDDKGLRTRGKLTLAVQQAREALELLRDEALDALSIGFQVMKADPVKDDNGRPVGRLLREIRLWEYSVVTFPANPLARVGVVKADNHDLAGLLEQLKTFDPETVRALLGQQAAGAARAESQPARGATAARAIRDYIATT